MCEAYDALCCSAAASRHPNPGPLKCPTDSEPIHRTLICRPPCKISTFSKLSWTTSLTLSVARMPRRASPKALGVRARELNAAQDIADPQECGAPQRIRKITFISPSACSNGQAAQRRKHTRASQFAQIIFLGMFARRLRGHHCAHAVQPTPGS